MIRCSGWKGREGREGTRLGDGALRAGRGVGRMAERQGLFYSSWKCGGLRLYSSQKCDG